MNAAWESFHHATLELATSDPIKQRLIRSFSSHLKDLDVTKLPQELRGDFQQLVSRLTEIRPLRGETAVMATVRKMSNEEAAACAREIVDLMASLGTARTNGERPRQPRHRAVLSLYSAEA